MSQLRAACSFLGRKPSREASLGKARPWQSSLTPGTLPDRASEQSWNSALLEAHLALAKQGFSRPRLGCICFPWGSSLPHKLFTRLQGGGALRLLPVSAASPELGWEVEATHAGAGTSHLHTSLL